jgi:hypothetical protein
MSSEDQVDQSTSELKSDKHFCYLYRDPKTQKILYVGYGIDPQRAHTAGHNAEVEALGNDGVGIEIWIAGPYESEWAARNVEAALVSAISPELNRIEQPGIKFRPLGMPGHLFERRSLPILNVHQVGELAGGAIVVYCNFDSQLKSGKQKLTLTNFSDDVVFDNIQDHWWVKKFMPQWIERPETSPKTLVAVQGPKNDRVIVGSASIDINGWSTTPAAEWDHKVHRIPLHRENGLDNHELRGRRIDVTFNSSAWNYVMVVDPSGLVLHGYKLKGLKGSK